VGGERTGEGEADLDFLERDLRRSSEDSSLSAGAEAIRGVSNAFLFFPTSKGEVLLIDEGPALFEVSSSKKIFAFLRTLSAFFTLFAASCVGVRTEAAFGGVAFDLASFIAPVVGGLTGGGGGGGTTLGFGQSLGFMVAAMVVESGQGMNRSSSVVLSIKRL
jgi:hypothetical protein